MAQPATGDGRRSQGLPDTPGAPDADAARPMPTPRARRRARLSAYDVAACGLLACIALICGYVEAVFPLPVPVPGVKLGLGNVVVLFALVAFGWRAGLLVMFVKVAASALLFGNPTIFLYSLAGGLLSFGAMRVGVRLRPLSVVGVSMLGGVCHMLGQLAVVALVLAPYVALAYLPVLVAAGLATGLLTGYVCRLVIRTAGRSSFFARRRRRLARAGRRTGGRGSDPAVLSPSSAGTADPAGLAGMSAPTPAAAPEENRSPAAEAAPTKEMLP